MDSTSAFGSAHHGSGLHGVSPVRSRAWARIASPAAPGVLRANYASMGAGGGARGSEHAPWRRARGKPGPAAFMYTSAHRRSRRGLSSRLPLILHQRIEENRSRAPAGAWGFARARPPSREREASSRCTARLRRRAPPPRVRRTTRAACPRILVKVSQDARLDRPDLDQRRGACRRSRLSKKSRTPRRAGPCRTCTSAPALEPLHRLANARPVHLILLGEVRRLRRQCVTGPESFPPSRSTASAWSAMRSATHFGRAVVILVRPVSTPGGPWTNRPGSRDGVRGWSDQ